MGHTKKTNFKTQCAKDCGPHNPAYEYGRMCDYMGFGFYTAQAVF